MELIEELEYLDEDTFNQITEDPFQKFVKEQKSTTIIEPIKIEDKRKIDKISCNEIDLYILKLQLHTGYLFTEDEEKLTQEEKFKILIKNMQLRIETYQRLGRSTKVVERLISTLKGNSK